MDRINTLLKRVVKPGRYTGGEYGAVKKEHDGKVLFALAFPDIYEVGMSHLGSQLLYSEINSRNDSCCERVYSPWPDFEELLRNSRTNLFTLESRTAVREFDLLGITLQYELTYSNVLNLLDLSGVELQAQARGEDQPIVIGGGPCAYNPAPVAAFFDCFLIGEGDEAVHEICAETARWKNAGKPGGRPGALRQLAKIAGVYVPGISAKTVLKRVCKDVDRTAATLQQIVPNIEIVHDRAMLEVFRGCTRGCRFCQAGYLYRPVRERSFDNAVETSARLLKNSGYNEIALTSLSSADYSRIEDCIDKLQSEFYCDRINVSLPSLRVDSMSVKLAEKVQNVRKGSMTFAPEAGTQRMRDIINKNVSDDDIDNALSAAFAAGCRTIKLYFMIGLPFETDQDVLGIVETAIRADNLYRKATGKGGLRVTVSVSNFVPKAHTAFQTQKQNSIAEFQRKHALLRDAVRGKRWLSLKYHDAKASCLEGAFARGGAELSSVIEYAWHNGARFDGWSEQFDWEAWKSAFEKAGLDVEVYNQNIHERQPVAWNAVSAGVSENYFEREMAAASGGMTTNDCRRSDCTGCGVCQAIGVEPVDWGRKI